MRTRKVGKRMKSKKGKKIIWWCSVFVMILLMITGAFWYMYMFETSRGAGSSDCALSHLFNDIRGGVKDKEIVFGGMDGLTYLFNKLKEEMKKLSKNSIPDLELGQKGEDLENAITAYYEQFRNKTVPSCNPESPEKQVTPTIIEQLVPGINPIIDQETFYLSSAAMLINLGGTMINQMVGGELEQFEGVIDDFLAQIKELRANVTSAERTLHKQVDYQNRVSLFDQVLKGLVVAGCGILGFYFLLMTCSLRCGKCVKTANCLQGLLAIGKITFSVVLNTVAIACIGIFKSNLRVVYCGDEWMLLC